AFSKTKLHNLHSGLGKQIELFLSIQIFLKQGEEGEISPQEQFLITALGKRHAHQQFIKRTDHAIAQIEGKADKSVEDLLKLHHLHQQVYYNPDTKKIDLSESHLPEAVKNLDLYYLISKLRYIAEMKTREKIMSIQYNYSQVDKVLSLTLKSGLLKECPLLEIYYKLVCIYMTEASEQNFHSLISDFKTHFSILPKMDQILLSRLLINIGISLLARDCAVEPELFGIYKLTIEKNILLSEFRLTHTGFINIVNLASICNEFEWTKNFIKEYAPQLEESKQKASIDLGYALVHYYDGHLDEAQNFLNSAELYGIPMFDMIGKKVLIQTALDRLLLERKDYFDFLSDKLASYEKFIRRHKQLTKEKKEAQLNWVKFIRKIASVKHANIKVPESKKEQLRNKLKPIYPVLSKRWLESRIELL
ncbi:MAG: hypothetical protein R2778_19470, partial [Saprospiraceae bacterium]